jgi:rod shape-determining protein MreC
MLRRPHFIALGVVLFLTLVLLNLPHHTAGQLKLAVGTLFLPFFGLSKSTHQLAWEAEDANASRTGLLGQLDDLRRSNQALRLKAMEAESLLRENEQLREHLGLRRQLPWQQLKLARVVGRDPANWWLNIQIELGTRDGAGIRENLPVLSTEGYLIGRLTSVGANNSRVVLLGDPDCKVSVEVEKTREVGMIVGGAGPLDNTMVSLSYLSRTARPKAGQRVLTSGLGMVYPKDLLVGQIADEARPAAEGSFSEVRVKLAADFGTLEYVWVVVP